MASNKQLKPKRIQNQIMLCVIVFFKIIDIDNGFANDELIFFSKELKTLIKKEGGK